MKADNFAKGRAGEERARLYLESLGWITVAQNFSTRWGEIDLIMDDGQKLIFVEVKFKSKFSRGRPEEMIGPQKISQIRRTAEVFMSRNHQWTDTRTSWRIDAICIDGELRHYKNIDG